MRDASSQMYMRNRYYDPATGQFTQADPIGLAGGLNAFGFANGDPITYSDPYGLSPEELDGDASEIDENACCLALLRAIPGAVRGWRAARAATRAGRLLSQRAVAAGRSTLTQQGNRILTMNRHAATGSRGTGSQAAHDFARAGLDLQDVTRAVTRDIGDLSRLPVGTAAQQTIQVSGKTVVYRTHTLNTGETIVNMWMP